MILNAFHVIRPSQRRQFSDAGSFHEDIAREVPIASTLARAGQMAALIERSPEPSPFVSRRTGSEDRGARCPSPLDVTPSSDAVPPTAGASHSAYSLAEASHPARPGVVAARPRYAPGASVRTHRAVTRSDGHADLHAPAAVSLRPIDNSL